MKRLLKLGRDQRGTTLIEMALVIPFLASLLIGMVDLSRGYSAKLKLEQAAHRSIEKAMNGRKDTTLFATLRTEAATAAGVALSAVTVRYWLECDGVDQNTSAATMDADYGRVCDDGETIARYVNVRINKNYAPLFSVRFAGSNADGSFTMRGEAGIRVQ